MVQMVIPDAQGAIRNPGAGDATFNPGFWVRRCAAPRKSAYGLLRAS